jgi:hypothetical protein
MNCAGQIILHDPDPTVVTFDADIRISLSDFRQSIQHEIVARKEIKWTRISKSDPDEIK